MNYMNIVKDDTYVNKYKVDYVVDHTPFSTIVDENTARLLEHAKIAGRSELSADLRRLLEFSY